MPAGVFLRDGAPSISVHRQCGVLVEDLRRINVQLRHLDGNGDTTLTASGRLVPTARGWSFMRV